METVTVETTRLLGLALALGFRGLCRPVRVALGEAGLGHRLAHRFEVRDCVIAVAIGEQDGELLPAIAVRPTAAADGGEAAGDQAQHLVADVMAVGVVEGLDVVDVDHGDGVASVGAGQHRIRRPAPRQRGQLVDEGEAVALPHQGQRQAGEGCRRPEVAVRPEGAYH